MNPNQQDTKPKNKTTARRDVRHTQKKAQDTRYNHYRSEVLTFLYEKQRKVESIEVKDKSKKAEKQDKTSDVA